MHRIDTSTAGPNVNGSGKAGFLDGVVPSTPPTQCNASWFNSVQEEIAAVIEGQKSALITGTNNQLDTALSQIIKGLTSTAGAGGVTTLTVSSNAMQFLTGTANQTYKLPDETTLAVGRAFQFYNVGTGILTVTDSSGTTLFTILPDTTANRAQQGIAVSSSAATATGGWRYSYDVPGQMVGTNTNDSAAAGIFGETMGPVGTARSSSITFASSSQVQNLSTLILTPGNWVVAAMGGIENSSTVSSGVIGVSQTSATLPALSSFSFPNTTTGEAAAYYQRPTSTLDSTTLSIPPYPVSVAAGSTKQLWLIATATFGSTASTAYGSFWARRAR